MDTFGQYRTAEHLEIADARHGFCGSITSSFCRIFFGSVFLPLVWPRRMCTEVDLTRVKGKLPAFPDGPVPHRKLKSLGVNGARRRSEEGNTGSVRICPALFLN
jgi:hypothetical protein